MLNNLLTKFQRKNILLILLSAIFIICSFFTYYNYQKLDELSKIQNATKLAVKISALVHNTQRERGASVGYISSVGDNFISQLKDIRKDTDKTQEELKNYYNRFDFTNYPQEMQNKASIAINILNKLKAQRKAIQEISTTRQKAQEYYSILNSFLIDSIDYIAKISSNKSISKQLYAFSSFLNLKEQVGIERLLLTAAFTKNYFPEDDYKYFIDVVNNENIYLNNFLFMASAKNIVFYKDTLKSKEVQKAKQMIKTAIMHKEGGFNIEAAYWFKIITAKVNLLKKVENHLSEDILANVSALQKEVKYAFIFSLIATILCLVFSVYFLRKKI